jgi:hypothetical protein
MFLNNDQLSEVLKYFKAKMKACLPTDLNITEQLYIEIIDWKHMQPKRLEINFPLLNSPSLLAQVQTHLC